MLVDRSSQISDLSVSLFDDSVEPVQFLSQHVDLVVIVASHSLECVFVLDVLALDRINFLTHCLELLLQFAYLSSRQSQGLLRVEDFLIESLVFSEQFLDSGLVRVHLLAGRPVPVLEVIHLAAHPVSLG